MPIGINLVKLNIVMNFFCITNIKKYTIFFFLIFNYLNITFFRYLLKFHKISF